MRHGEEMARRVEEKDEAGEGGVRLGIETVEKCSIKTAEKLRIRYGRL